MPGPALTSQQVDTLAQRGVLPLASLISPECITAARQHVERSFSRAGLWKDGWHLSHLPQPPWPASGFDTAAFLDHAHPAVEALIEDPALRQVIDRLFEHDAIDRTFYARPQLLFSLPSPGPWSVPCAHWHLDIPRLASGRQPGVQLFTFLDRVAPQGGGTLVVAGSHRLLNDGRFHRSKALRRHLSQLRYFRDLCSPHLPHRAQLLGQIAREDGVDLEVVELHGNPGDVYLTDLRLLHTGAPNVTPHPRLMATYRFLRASVVPELRQAYGWAPEQ